MWGLEVHGFEGVGGGEGELGGGRAGFEVDEVEFGGLVEVGVGEYGLGLVGGELVGLDGAEHLGDGGEGVGGEVELFEFFDAGVSAVGAHECSCAIVRETNIADFKVACGVLGDGAIGVVGVEVGVAGLFGEVPEGA